MEKIEHTDELGRKYQALKDGDIVMPLGPPEGLVDELGLPEPIATRLHNALYRRGILTYQDATRNHQNLIGALQEVLMVDVQKLTEVFFRFENQEVPNE